MNNEEPKSRVDDLSDRLYSRTRYHNPIGKRSPIRNTDPSSEDAPPVSEKWSSPELNEILMRERKGTEVTPFMKKFFTFALFFFGATILVSALIFLRGSNFVSSKNVDIKVVGPAAVSAGEVLELGVTIENNNNTDLELVNLSVQYPQGARDATDIAQALTFQKTEVGEIGAGDESVRDVAFVLIGTTGEVKQIKFSVEYRVKGSDATFYKDKIYDITIGEAPLTISVESPPSVTSGDTFTTKVVLSLSSADVLKNVMLKVEYPYGYSVTSAKPEAISENNVWALGDFSRGTEKTIEITGRMVGEDQDERTMRFYAGVSDNGSFGPDFKSIIISTQETIAIERPSLGLSATFNGESAPVYIAPAGREVSTTIRYQNNLPERIINPRLEMVFTGRAFDKDSIRVYNDGEFNQSSGRVIWDLRNVSGNRELLPGQNGTVSLSFASLPEEALSPASKDIGIELRLTGTPAGSGNRAVTVTENRTVRVASQVTLSSKAFYSIGPFRNTGPIPPKVGSETTYTMVWNVGNTQGDIADAKVTARLGNGVKWLSAAGIASEEVSFDESTGVLSWNIGSLSSGSGFTSSSREAAFQVAFTPTLGQAGTAPVILSGIVFSGRDAQTGAAVNVSNSPLTTRIDQDPSFIQGNDIVVR